MNKPHYSRLMICASLLLIIVGLAGCREDFEFEPSQGNLEFSRDTVFLDTVFTNIGSSTYMLKVYNRNDEDIVIPTVGLAQGENSRYRLAVDGVPGKVFEDVELLANDSLFVFIETTVDIQEFVNGDQFLYEDKILFDSGANEQSIPLITLVRDAIFLFPERNDTGTTETLLLGEDEEGNEIRVSGFFLDDTELNLTADLPYVIYGFAAVPPDRTLNIAAGARLFFHANSGIIVANEGSISVNGTVSSTEEMENEVIMEGDRLEPAYSDRSGQWFGIWMTAGSKNNRLEHLTLKNATIGLLADSSNTASTGETLQIYNSKILNCSSVGLLATTAEIRAENTVINNCGQNSLSIRLGGSYSFINCTFANYYSEGFRQTPAVNITNGFPQTELTEPLTQTLFENCIIYGDRDVELIYQVVQGVPFNVEMNNSLLKFDDRFDNIRNDGVYDFSDTSIYTNLLLNQEPQFLEPFDNMLQIPDGSPADGLADPATAPAIDITGSNRGTPPDAGAYESIDFDN